MKKFRVVLLLVVAALLLNVQIVSAIGVKIVTNDLYADGTMYSFDPLGSVTPIAGPNTWAVARITDIMGDMDNNGVYETSLFNASSSPYELTVYSYGYYDQYVENYRVGGPSSTKVEQKIFTSGGTFKIYQDYSKDYDPTSIANDGATGTYNKLYTAASTVTDGSLWLELQGTPDQDGYTLSETLKNYDWAYSGSMFLDVIGGSERSSYDTNGQGGSDIFYSFSAIIMNDGTRPTGDGALMGLWDTFDDGTAIGARIPEPASLLLLGLGLFGLGIVRRFRKN